MNRLQSLLMQLRKVCNHPFLFPNSEPDFDGTTTEELVEASGKLELLNRMIPKLLANKHRILIFSQFTSMLDILEDFLQLRDWPYYRLDGSANRVQRSIDIRSFNQGEFGVDIFIMSTRAGGLGINLQTADTVVLFDSDWNPQVPPSPL